ncbi:MAG: hypothetical protein U5K00_05145 [Melioribacteraceae bacterium]|nr:hypothetical protein [Melioribacteraceae bacterium]
MLKVVSDDDMPEEIRVALIEAFGWYYFSEKRGEIIDAVDALISKNNTPESIRNEAIKTKNRLITGNNVSITP